MRKVLDEEKLAKEEMAKGPYVQLLEAGHSCHRPFLVGYLCAASPVSLDKSNTNKDKYKSSMRWDGR